MKSSVLGLACVSVLFNTVFAASVANQFMGVPIYQFGAGSNGTLPVIDNNEGVISVSTSELAQMLGVSEMPGSINGTFAKYVYVNYDTQQNTVALYNNAVNSSDAATALALYNVLTSGGLLMDDYFTAQSAINSQAVQWFQQSGINAEVFGLERMATNSLVSALASSTASTTSTSAEILSSNTKRSVSYTVYCDFSHVPDYDDCQNLVNQLFTADTVFMGNENPRNIEYGRCYTSWSEECDFLTMWLWNAANAMLNSCVHITMSGKATNVELGQYTLTQCLSNRATGCT